MSGQAKQLDDLRLENDELLLQQQNLDEELKRLKAVADYVQISPNSRLKHVKSDDEPIDLIVLQNRLRDSEINKKSAIDELELVQNVLATCRAQNSAAEIEIRILNSQLEAITDASMANERVLRKRIKDLEMIAMENQGSGCSGADNLKLNMEFNLALNGDSSSQLSFGDYSQYKTL